MEKEKLDEILESHSNWLKNDGGERANLRGANLRGANLREANLRHADLREANLREANLRHADLREANLRDADLRDADLRHADLRGADLREANLRHADLREANLRHANLDLDEFTILPAGSLEVWKGCDGKVIKLKIPSDAERINAIGSRKCRASKAEVLAVYDTDKIKIDDPPRLYSKYDSEFYYEVGEVAVPDSFDDDPRIECSNGIHFHLTFQEAKEWA